MSRIHISTMVSLVVTLAVILLGSISIPVEASTAVSVGGVSSAKDTGCADLVWAHTRGANGNLLIVYGMSDHVSSPAITATYGSTAMSTGQGAVGDDYSTIMFFLDDITSDEDITINFTGCPGLSNRHWGGAVDFAGADTAPADGATDTGTGTSSSVTVSNVGDDDFVFDAIAEDNGSPSAGTNQTERWNLNQQGDYSGGSTQDGADGGVMSWSWGQSREFAHMALRIPHAP